jgi:SEC-C motif
MAAPEAKCRNGHNFTVPGALAIEPGVRSAPLINVGVGPCPICGEIGRVTDGLYSNIDGRLVWTELRSAAAGLGGNTAEQLRLIQARLEELASTQVTTDDLAAALAEHMPQPKSWFSSPGGMATGQWISVLLAVIALILAWKSENENSGDFTPQQVEHIVHDLEDNPSFRLPADPARHTTPYAPGSVNEGGRPPKGHEPCSCGSGMKFRDCCRRSTAIT